MSFGGLIRFYDKYNFPGIIGAIDCTHIAIITPDTDNPIRPGLAYYNRNGFYSKCSNDNALQFAFKICDANLKILNCNARFPGSTHDAALWSMFAVFRYPQPWLLTPIEDANPSTPEGNTQSTTCSKCD
ncbi:hypothetical protein HUJ05_001637 [Dendroctonus ponderosae]|nr:hypothetical protein HUJ05_001637 [Dendroctonus ponderosae]